MQKRLINFLICPTCKKGDLILKHVAEKFILNYNNSECEFIKTGLLQCIGCLATYPIIDEIPSILRKDMMNDKEKDFLINYDLSGESKVIDYQPFTEDERHEKMETHLKKFDFYREDSYQDEKSRLWIRNTINYEVK